MEKIKVTKKEMKENFYILGSGYCELDDLLRYNAPVAYSCGVYGWSCDYYNFDFTGLVLSTGYNYIEQNIKHDYELQKKYNDKAKKINYNNKLNYEQKKKKVNKLLEEYIRSELDRELKRRYGE